MGERERYLERQRAREIERLIITDRSEDTVLLVFYPYSSLCTSLVTTLATTPRTSLVTTLATTPRTLQLDLIPHPSLSLYPLPLHFPTHSLS